MTDRMARVSEEFREVLAEEIPRLKDPRVGFVTVTHVEVTADLRKARVWYTVMGDEKERRATQAALRSARSHLRHVVGEEIRLKFTPELEFLEDAGVENLQRIDALLRELVPAREDDSGGGNDEGDDDDDDDER